MKRAFLLGCVCLFGVACFSQNDPVLMRINGREFTRSRFEYGFKHYSAHAGVRLSVKEYADIFIASQLKVKAAEAQGIDTVFDFRKQRESYRASLLGFHLLGRNFLDDGTHEMYRNITKHALSEQVKVIQICKYLPQAATSRHLHMEQVRMDSIAEQIKRNTNIAFENLVERFSDDKRTRWIGRLQETSEFEKVAFSLNKGETSHPFFTPEGIHLVKVVDRKGTPEYKDVYAWLVERLMRSQKGEERILSRAEELKSENGFVRNPEGIGELLIKGKTEKELFAIDGRSYTGRMFQKFASSRPQSVKRQLQSFICKSLLDDEKRRMTEKYPEMRYVLQEYADSLLIGEVTRRVIDEPAMNDRAGLATYFKFHSSHYRWDAPRYKGAVLHCTDKRTAKRAKRVLKKTPFEEWTALLQQTFNANGTEQIKIEQGTFSEGDNKYVDKLVFRKEDFASIASHPFTVVVGEKKKGPDDYREVIDSVRKDYRIFLLASWERELRTAAKVEINQEVLKTVNKD